MATRYKRGKEGYAFGCGDAASAGARWKWPFLFLLAVFSMAAVLSNSVMTLRSGQEPLLYGEGVISDKLTDDQAGLHYLLYVFVVLEDGNGAFDYVETDPETWRRLAKGGRIGVVYQRNRTGTRIKIYEAGPVASPPVNR